MKKLVSIILSAAILLSIAAFVSADGVDGPKPEETIKVAVNAEFEPFEYYENGELCGFDIDLMNAIGERAGYGIEYLNMDFDKLFAAVNEGEADCAISTITRTSERQKSIDFSRPYLRATVTHNEGEAQTKKQELYSIIFPLNASHKSELLLASGQQSIYADVNNALGELIDDGSVDELINKHNLNKPFDEEAEYNYRYDTVKGSQSPPAKVDGNAGTSATSVPHSEWAGEEIEKAKQLNIINYGGNYNFPGAITREEFCELIYNYCANVIGKLEPVEAESKFTDTDNAHIKILNTAGIIEGKSETEFAPKDYLTREEAATILLRMVNKTIDVPVTEMYFVFDDGSDISDWADNAVQVMCNMGVMKGVGNNRFAPKGTYTTEQAIVTIMRVYKAQSVNIGIIGGADGPTEIIVGGGTPGAYVNDFNYKLNQLMPDDKNYMFSPLSIKMAFAMVANGAEGETQKELMTALGIEDLDVFNKRAKELMSAYTSTDVLKLNCANSLWINKDRRTGDFTEKFKDTAKEYYNAEVNVTDDKSIVDDVNSWAEEQTNGKIKNVLSKNEVEVILANALYFKGAWQNDFSKSATKKDTFTSRDGSKKEIDFMNKTAYMQYHNIVGTELVELAYERYQSVVDKEGMVTDVKKSDADISMYLIKGEDKGYTELLKYLARNRGANKATYVQLKVPKFEFESEFGLNDIMKELGATKAFLEYEAEFSPMVGKESLGFHIIDSLQKTYIKVDEEGTEAAAVTVAMGAAQGVQNYPEPVVMSFDEPFTFIIYDNTNCEALFMGEYAYAE